MNWQEELRALDIPIRYHEPLAKHTTLRIGGPADAFVEVTDVDALRKLADFTRHVPVLVIGRGSNLLVSDNGFRGIVIQLVDAFESLSADHERIWAGSGVALPRLARFAAHRGLSGLEFALGVPGSVGGGLIMNAGAWAQQMSDTVRIVEVMTHTGELLSLDAHQAGFSYRRSNLSNYFAITRARFDCVSSTVEQVTSEMQALYQQKIAAQPFAEQNAGCMFKNPPGDSAGRLIDACGLKGTRVGDMEVSTKHANFIVNHGQGTAADLLKLIEHIRHTVHQRTDIWLELEVRQVE